MSEKQAHFEVYRDEAKEYRWRLKAGNGEIVATSEGYTKKSSARRSAEKVKQEAAYAVTADIRDGGSS